MPVNEAPNFGADAFVQPPPPDPPAQEPVPEPETEEQAKQRVAAEKAADDAKEAAELAAHPHNLLKALAKDLQTPRMDLHDRISATHRVLAGLIQVVLAHTPGPEEDPQPVPDEPSFAERENIG